MIKTSVVVTTKNEIDSITALLQSLLVQKGLDELVVVDGGSTDGTVETVQTFAKTATFPVNLIVDPKANIARGRNIAITNAQGEIIAVTDAGCEVGPNWLESLIKPFDDPNVAMVSGFFKAAHADLSHNILSAVTIPALYEIEAGRFLPSSRSFAFRKNIWESVGHYPEWLPICEDLVFDLKIKRSGAIDKFVPEAWVIWFVRSSWRQYFWQYYRYARGDGHAKLWPRRHLIRYTTYLTAFVLLGLMISVSWLFVIPMIVGFGAYMLKFWRRFLNHYPHEPLQNYVIAFVVIPLLVIEGDIAKMIGYPVGRWQRLKGVVHPEPF